MDSNLYLAVEEKKDKGQRNASTSPTSDYNNDLKYKVNFITKYQDKYMRLLSEFSRKSPGNASTVCEFIAAEQNEINFKESTKERKIKNLI